MSTLKLLLIGLGARAATIAIGIANTVFLARSLGPAAVGEYFLLVRLVAILTVLADLGMRQSAIAFASVHEDWSGRIHGFLLRFTVLSSVITSLIAAGVLWSAKDLLLPHFPQKWVWMAFTILPLALYANSWNGLMIGRGRIWELNWVQLLVSTSVLGLNIVFIKGFSGGLIAAVLIYLTTTLAQVLIMITLVYRGSTRETDLVPNNLSRQMMSFGLRTYPGWVANILWANIPVFILNAFYGPSAVGIFSVAQQLVEKLLVPIQALHEAIFKQISAMPRHAAVLKTNQYVRVTSWFIAISMFVGIVFGPWLVVTFLGVEYASAGQVVRLLLPGTAALCVPFLLNAFFVGQLRRPGLLSILSWVNVLVNLILSSIFVSKLAESGAALAMTISQVFGTLAALALYMKLTDTGIKQLIQLDSTDFAMIRERVCALTGKRSA